MMMEQFNLYSLSALGLTESDLLAIKESALASVSSGKSVTSVNAPGLSTSFQLHAAPWEIVRSAQFALQQINPTRYGTPIQNQTIGFTR